MKQRADFASYSDTKLDDDLAALATRERDCLAEILAYLAEVDERKSYRRAGYSSMHGYVTGHLGYDEDQAKPRIRAARLLRQYPAVGPLVARGALHLSGLRLLAPRLTEANHRELLAAAAFKTKRQIEELLAARFAKTEKLALVVPTAAGARQTETNDAPDPIAARSPDGTAPPLPLGETQPLSAQSFALSCTISRSCHDKLGQARDLLRHAEPAGDVGAIIERALDALLETLHKRKFAATDTPRKNAPGPRPNSRTIAAEIIRGVVARDGYRCAYVSPDGKLFCRAHTALLLNFHEVEIYSRGNEEAGRRRSRRGSRSEPVRPQPHAGPAVNQYAAELDFGREHMARARQCAPGPVAPPPPAPAPPPPLNHREHPDTLLPLSAAMKADAVAALFHSGFKRHEAQRAVATATDDLPDHCSLAELVRRSFQCTAR